MLANYNIFECKNELFSILKIIHGLRTLLYCFFRSFADLLSDLHQSFWNLFHFGTVVADAVKQEGSGIKYFGPILGFLLCFVHW